MLDIPVLESAAGWEMTSLMPNGIGIEKPSDGARVLGAQVRCLPSLIEVAQWLPPNALRDEVEGIPAIPISFDRAIWPTPSDRGEGEMGGRAADVRKVELLLELDRTIAEAEETASTDTCTLALCLPSPRGAFAKSLATAPSQESAVVGQLASNRWTFLGYEALDSGLAMSGLLNFGTAAYACAEQVALEQHIKLTSNLLWPNLRGAASFAEGMDSLAREHAPFEVVGLFVSCRANSFYRRP